MSERRYPNLDGLRELAGLARGVSWQSPVRIEFHQAFDPATALTLLDRLAVAEGRPLTPTPEAKP